MKIYISPLYLFLVMIHLDAAYKPEGSIHYEPMVGAIPGWFIQYPPMQSSIRAKNYRSKKCGPSAGCERGCTVAQGACIQAERAIENDDIINDECPEYW
jgi:hypothetical protein